MSELDWTSGLSFFVPSSVYKKNQMSEIAFLIGKGFTYSDLLIMPIHERTNYVNLYLDANS